MLYNPSRLCAIINQQIMAQPLQSFINLPVQVMFKPRPALWLALPADNRQSLRCVLSRDENDGRTLNPGAIRDIFLSLKDWDELKLFLDGTGHFFGPAPRSREFAIEFFWSWRDFLRAVLQGPKRDWDYLRQQYGDERVNWVCHRVLPFETDLSKPSPRAAITAKSTLEAMVAATQLDLLRGARFGWCIRPDCRKMYEITSAHRRKYCSQECGHLQSIRSKRGTVVSQTN
jgi:hypothetical protein